LSLTTFYAAMSSFLAALVIVESLVQRCRAADVVVQRRTHTCCEYRFWREKMSGVEVAEPNCGSRKCRGSKLRSRNVDRGNVGCRSCGAELWIEKMSGVEVAEPNCGPLEFLGWSSQIWQIPIAVLPTAHHLY